VAVDAVAAPGGVAGKAEVQARGLSSLVGGGLPRAHASQWNLEGGTGKVGETAMATDADATATGQAAEEEEGGGSDAVGMGLALARSAPAAHGDDVRDRGARGAADQEDRPRASSGSIRARPGAGCSSGTGSASSDGADVVMSR
jgi:hypothetical protein